MARLTAPQIRRSAVFVKERRGGKDVFVQRPYDIVEYNWLDGPSTTYMQPHFYRTRSITESEVVYDDVRTYTDYPAWDLSHPARP